MNILNKKTYCLYFATVCMLATAVSQTKLEKEYRLKAEEVPREALQYVNSFNFKNNVKWYFERNETASSIEAKTYTEEGKYSIEFSDNGSLEDIEIEMDFNAVPEVTRLVIQSYFKNNFKRHNIRKTQMQITGDPADIKSRLTSKSQPAPIAINYELIAKGKDDEGVHLYELLFSENGELIRRAKIVFSSTNNLEY